MTLDYSWPLWGVSELCNNYLEGGGGGWKIRGRGIGENDNKREGGGLDVKFNTCRGRHYVFIPFCKLEMLWKSY